MDSLTIQESRAGDVPVLTLSGYVDADTAPLLYRELNRLRELGCRRFVVDCRGLTYLSSYGIWTLVKHIMSLREEGGDIRLAGIGRNVAMIIRDLNMQKFFDAYPDIPTAIASFGPLPPDGSTPADAPVV